MISLFFLLGLSNESKEKVMRRRLSDILCDNTDIDKLPSNIFDLNSELVSCKDRPGNGNYGKYGDQ